MVSLEYFENHAITLSITDGDLIAKPPRKINRFLRSMIERNRQSLIDQLIARERGIDYRPEKPTATRLSALQRATVHKPKQKSKRPSLATQKPDRFTGGVGTELRAILPDFFVRAGCGCRSYARSLDNRGIAWCDNNRETIMQEAKQHAREAFSRSDELTPKVLDQAIEQAKTAFYAWQVKGKDVAIMPDDLMRVEPFSPSSRLAIVTVAIGDEIQQQARYTLPSIKAYAQRCGADLHVITDDRCPAFVLGNKFRTAEIAKRYDRTLFLDIDVFVKPTAPNVFETLKPGAVWIHPDITKNTPGISHLKHCMAWVGDVDSQELWRQSQVNNTGVVLFDREHCEIWNPPERLPKYHCAEQDWVGYQLLRRNIPVKPLPPEWNCQYWWKDFTKQKATAHFVHLAACKDRSQWEPVFRSLNKTRRIVVATTPRTGSSLLVDSLAAHPWALSAGEAFNDRYPLERRWPIGAINLAKAMPWDVDDDRYGSLIDDSLIVYLFRRDIDAQIDSWRKACKTGIWRNGEPDPQPVEWIGDHEAERIITEADKLWSGAELTIAYEDMIADWNGTVSKILNAANWTDYEIEQAHERQAKQRHETPANETALHR